MGKGAWVEPMAEAWQAVAEGRWRDAQKLIEGIALTGDLGNAVLSVIDTTLETLGLGTDEPPDGLMFVNRGTGTKQWADDVPPEVAWSGRLVMARLRDDEPTFKAVFGTIPEDETWIVYPLTLMHSCLLQVRTAQGRQPQTFL